MQNWSPNFSSDQVKKCATDNDNGLPRFVITHSTSERPVVYTDSLTSCIGVLVFENSSSGSVAGLAHFMPTERDLKIVSEMILKIEQSFGALALNTVLAVGDDPSPSMFEELVRVLDDFSAISEGIEVVYGGSGSPWFLTGDGGHESTRIAYNTSRACLHIGRDS